MVDGLGVVAGKAESLQEWERHNLERRPKLQWRGGEKSAPDFLVILR